MAEERVKRKLAAIVSADVVGWSRLMGEDEAGTLATLKRHREELIDPKIAEYGGRIVSTAGDSLLIEYPSAVDAVRCSLEIQDALAARNAELPENAKMLFRFGVNMGDVIIDGEDVFGDGVNVAARLQALASPGALCLSGKVYDEVRGKLALTARDLGSQTVKNIAAPIHVFEVTPSSEALATRAPAAVLKQSPRRWAAIGGGALLLIAAIAVAVWQLYPSPTDEVPALALPDKPSIAVLPFKNLSGDPEQEYFVDGFTDEIITELSRFQTLFVIASTSVFAYKGKAVTVQQVARELGVRYVLEGSVQKAGDRLRIAAQLVDATTGQNVWAESYDRDVTDLFAVQDEVTQKIVGAVGSEYGGQVASAGLERAKRKPTENLEAYDYYLLGYEHWGRSTKEDNAIARQMLEKAIELDPEFARAHAQLAWVHRWDQKWWSDSPAESGERAFELAKKAVALDPSDGYNHWVLGSMYFYNRHQYDEGVLEFERALALNPNDADALVNWGYLLSFMGRAEEGIEMAQKAMRLNPHYTDFYIWFLGAPFYNAGRYEEAIATLKKMRQHHLDTRVLLAASYAQVGREAEARAITAEVLEEYPDFSLQRKAEQMYYTTQAGQDHYIEGMRKAGLPE